MINVYYVLQRTYVNIYDITIMALLSDKSKGILRILVGFTKEKARDFGWFMGEVTDLLMDPYGKVGRGMAPRQIYWSVDNLQRRGYLEKFERAGKKMITITDKGKLALLAHTICEKQQQQHWDEKWRLVIFDIPEEDRRERNFLRSYLKSFGLHELQKSVWVFPYDIEQEFYMFLKACNKKFKGDIRFITVQKMSRDSDLKKHFGL